MTDVEIAERITRRRRQVLVHSIIYYEFDDNLIPDYQWQYWADELTELQLQHPSIAKTCDLHELFHDFDGSTGCHLPARAQWGWETARLLIRLRDRRYSEGA